MVLSTIDETDISSYANGPLKVQTHFTPNSTRPNSMPYSTRIANATEPLSTTSIIFSMKPHTNTNDSKVFFHGDDTHREEAEYSDIFRKWDDDVSSVGQRSVGSKRRDDVESLHTHRRVQSETTVPRMDDWMNDKLNKYESFKNGDIKKMDLTPKDNKKPVLSKGEVYLPSFKEKQTQQRDDASQKSQTDKDDPAMTQYFRTLGQNESLQNKLDIKTHEVASLQHRLEDTERWYQTRLEESTRENREADKLYNSTLEEIRKDHRDEMHLMGEEWEKRESEWMQDREKMEREISMLTSELREAKCETVEMRSTLEENRRLEEEIRGCKVQISELTKENDALESMKRDFVYLRNEKQSIAEEFEQERDRMYHELNEWKMRFHEETKHVRSMKQELDNEIARNATLLQEKNAMADMFNNSVTKMEQMQRHIMELEKDKVDLIVTNNQLDAENTRVNILAREKNLLEGTVDGYHTKIAKLEKKNHELESETISLKQELIDVLEVASQC